MEGYVNGIYIFNLFAPKDSDLSFPCVSRNCWLFVVLVVGCWLHKNQRDQILQAMEPEQMSVVIKPAEAAAAALALFRHCATIQNDNSHVILRGRFYRLF